MIELLIAVVVSILLYIIGTYLLPDQDSHEKTEPEPWQVHYKIHEKNLRGDDDE